MHDDPANKVKGADRIDVQKFISVYIEGLKTNGVAVRTNSFQIYLFKSTICTAL